MKKLIHIERVLICMPSVSACSAFVWKLSSKNLKKIIKKSNNVSVERGVATGRAQMVWPMMTVTVTNFVVFTRQQF